MSYTILYCLIAISLGFFLGMLYGVFGCKKDFGIPHGASPNDGEWLTHKTLGEVYGYFHARNSGSTEQ